MAEVVTPPSGRRIFITVAELSGDRHAAQLIRNLLELDPSITIEGFGGAEMRQAGALIHRETVRSAAMGFAAISRGPEVFRLLKFARDQFTAHRPDLLICCDSWGMNSHFAKAGHRAGIPVLYYIAPQAWASREGRVKKIRRWVNLLACILPFEEAYFQSHGINARFVGHPLFDELPRHAVAAVPDDFKVRPPVIGLLPGSRRGEATRNFPRMLVIAQMLRAAFPGVTFLVPTTVATDPIVRPMTATMPDIEIKRDSFDEFVPRCNLCITVSGTATLHVAGHAVPMIVVYNASETLWTLFGQWLVRTRTFALVNLLSAKHIVPEFVPWFGSPEPVGELALELLNHPEKMRQQVADLSHLIQTLDKPGASMNVARAAIELMNAANLQSGGQLRASGVGSAVVQGRDISGVRGS